MNELSRPSVLQTHKLCDNAKTIWTNATCNFVFHNTHLGQRNWISAVSIDQKRIEEKFPPKPQLCVVFAPYLRSGRKRIVSIWGVRCGAAARIIFWRFDSCITVQVVEGGITFHYPEAIWDLGCTHSPAITQALAAVKGRPHFLVIKPVARDTAIKKLIEFKGTQPLWRG